MLRDGRQIQLTLAPRHPNCGLVIDATKHFTQHPVGGRPNEVLYAHDQSPMGIGLTDIWRGRYLIAKLHYNMW